MTTVAQSIRKVGSSLRPRDIASILVAVLLSAQVGAAQTAQQSPDSRWPDIKAALIGDKAVLDGSELLTLTTPARALDASGPGSTRPPVATSTNSIW